MLSFDTIRLYDRVGITISIMQGDLQRYMDAMAALNAFTERFKSIPEAQIGLSQVDLTQLSKEELVEYRVHIGGMIAAAEGFKGRLRILRRICRSILDGATTEAELRAVITKMQDDLSNASKAVNDSSH